MSDDLVFGGCPIEAIYIRTAPNIRRARGETGNELNFASPANGFSLFVGSGLSNGTYTAEAFDGAHNLIASSSATVTKGEYGELFFPLASDISFVDVTSSMAVWVADDLSFDLTVPSPTPLPST